MALPVVADLKLVLGLETTAADTFLTADLLRARAVIETYLGRPIAAVEKTFIDPAETCVAYGVVRRLIIPVTPVELADPAPVVTDVDGTVVDATTYRVDGELGTITGKAGVSFGAGPYEIEATVGLEVASDYEARIEPALSQAILDLASEYYHHRNPGSKSESTAGVSVSYGADGLPPRVAAMVSAFRLFKA